MASQGSVIDLTDGVSDEVVIPVNSFYYMDIEEMSH